MWAIDFFINFNRVDFIRKIVTLKETSKAYLNSWLIPDAVALVGSVVNVFLGKMRVAKYFDLIRLLHFRDALYPVNLCVQKNTSSGQKRVQQIQSLIFVFFAFVTLGHLAACLWIVVGKRDEDLPLESRKSWLFVNDFN